MTAAPPGDRKPTRHDVAVLAGVSDAVVSYTLNGGAPVATETAARVRAAVAALGYRPNRAATALRSGSTHALALIAPTVDTPEPVSANPFFTEFFNAIEVAARDRGYALYTATAAELGPAGVLSYAKDFASRQVDGILILTDWPENQAALDQLHVPWIQLNASAAVPNAPSLGPDLYGGAFAVTEHLISHGHRRVGFLGEWPEPRHQGWLDACAQYGVEPGVAVQAEYGRLGGYLAGQEFVAHPDRPTAVFAASDLIAFGALRAFHESGVATPGELAIASLDGTVDGEYYWPRLTSFRQPIEAMAEAAVQGVLNTDEPHRHQIFTGTLVVRDSCGQHDATGAAIVM